MSRLDVTIKRIEIETQAEKIYNSIREAAKANGISEKTLSGHIKKGDVYLGYRWERKEKAQIVWQIWMINYLKEHYSGTQSISAIAKKLGKTEVQVKNKVDYLGLNIQPTKDDKEVDFENYQARISKIKEKVHKGSRIKVEVEVEEGIKGAVKVIEVKVDGCYEHFVNVIVRGIRRSYSWDDILEIVG